MDRRANWTIYRTKQPKIKLNTVQKYAVLFCSRNDWVVISLPSNVHIFMHGQWHQLLQQIPLELLLVSVCTECQNKPDNLHDLLIYFADRIHITNQTYNCVNEWVDHFCTLRRWYVSTAGTDSRDRLITKNMEYLESTIVRLVFDGLIF